MYFDATFQFLIGTLKTPFGLQAGLKAIVVSIPHRYAKNLGNLLIQVFYFSFNSS